jgi:hypothetical protein
MDSDFDAKWHELAEEVMSGMKEWRLQHPKASLREIERALDERLGKMRARMLQDAALASAAADIQAAQEGERPVCPQCGATLEARELHERELTTVLGEKHIRSENEHSCDGRKAYPFKIQSFQFRGQRLLRQEQAG